MSKIHTCECGFQWEHGRSGDHQCGPFYRDRIAALEKQNAELLAAINVITAIAVQGMCHGLLADESCRQIIEKANAKRWECPDCGNAAEFNHRGCDIFKTIASAPLQPSTQEVSNER